MTTYTITPKQVIQSDRESLELAAKAAGIRHSGSKGGDGLWVGHGNIIVGCLQSPRWNPLTDDGDALRLSVKLNLTIRICEFQKDTIVESQKIIGCQRIENHRNDPYAATRRAIVRAAAEIGRAMP